MPSLFDMNLRARRRDRAARMGTELFLYDRTFGDCLERLEHIGRQFERLLLIGCPNPAWPSRLGRCAKHIDVCDPGARFAANAGGQRAIEDESDIGEASYDAVLAIGTLDTVNDLPLALRLICRALCADGLFLGAMSGGDTLPQLRRAMHAADAVAGVAAPHVHPRIAGASLAPLLEMAGFVSPVVDVDHAVVSYSNLPGLVADLRAMAATNLLITRPYFVGRLAYQAAIDVFSASGEGGRTEETFDILHLAAWAPTKG